ncbi:MAG: FtsX-like permease family protein [Phycisphaerales bacterium]|jgi:lipoprotein-releasing system permease protein
MYHALLTRRYLFTKVMPLLAALGVTLCTAMVLVTWSVMGGFLTTLINSGRTLTGDVVVSWPGTGFAHYEDLISRLRKDPEVAGAAPMIETFGILRTPDGQSKGVAFRGVEGDSFRKVSDYDDILWWKAVDKPMPKDKKRLDLRLSEKGRPGLEAIYDRGLKLTRPDPVTGKPEPAIVPGIEVTQLNERTAAGFYVPWPPVITGLDGAQKMAGDYLFIGGNVTITVFPLDSQGRPIDAFSQPVPVANEFRTGMYDLDNRVVLVNLELLQKMLKMNALTVAADTPASNGGETFPDAGTPATRDQPARVTDVIVKGHALSSDPRDAQRLKARVEAIYAEFAKDHVGSVPAPSRILIHTWEDLNRQFIGAVRNEISLLLFLFCFVSLTAVFLVLAIFWSMVREKTPDIGVLRSLGAGRAGVAWLWVRYGVAIGVVGSILGLALAYAVVLNINPIHEWLGTTLGIVIWDPRVYYFTMIPNHVEPLNAVIVGVAGVLSCGVGAFVPAMRAAVMSPVRALRNE